MDNTAPQPIAIVSENTTSPTPKGRKSLWIVLIILAIVVVFSAGVFAGYILQTNTQTKNSDNLSRIESSITSTPSIADEDISYEKEYVSENLGIKFTYSTITDETYKWPVTISEEGNRIQFYVRPDGGEISKSHYLVVFDKGLDDNFQEAIEKSLLVTTNPGDCLVEVSTGGYMDSSSLYAKIQVPNESNLDMEQVFELAKKCPSDFVTTNYVNFFYYNTHRPDKFLYFSLGQDGSTLLKNGKQWYQTVEFVN